MRVFTVRKSEPNTDTEFAAYIALLEEIGIDLADAPRTLEPGTTNRWLYVWKSKPEATRFARVLGSRLRDPSWFVYELELSHEESGPLAPLTILSFPVHQGTVFKLEGTSQARIMLHHPNARLIGEVMHHGLFVFPQEGSEDNERQIDLTWDQVISPLTGISEDAITRLGGIRIVSLNGEILYERLPSIVSR